MRKKVLIAGLGNIGKEYERTRHNVGFCVVDELARLLGCTFSFKSSFHAYVAQHATAHGSFVLMKPAQFMNNSGSAVAALCAWHKIPTRENCFIVTDNTDLDVGVVRLKRPKHGKQTSTTHNGIRSIIQHLGHDLFLRMYLGIGSARASQKLSSYVLGRWHESEDAAYQAMISISAGVLAHALSQPFDALSQTLSKSLQASKLP